MQDGKRVREKLQVKESNFAQFLTSNRFTKSVSGSFFPSKTKCYSTVSFKLSLKAK